MKARFSHRSLNNLLTVVAVALGLYIAILPFYPNIELWVKSLTDTTGGYKYQSILADTSGKDFDGSLAAAPEENTLVIPKINFSDEILEGNNISVINNGGAWHRPGTSTPDKGGNTVLAGHRWSYDNATTFYHLDKLKIGDKFSIFWNKKEYVYQVFDIGVVPPTAIEIEAPTEAPIVTLYTCTPLWTAKDRLVVRAQLITSSGEVQNE